MNTDNTDLSRISRVPPGLNRITPLES